MIRMMWRRFRTRATTVLSVMLAAGGLAGCGGLLDASDPTAIMDDEVSNAQGAELLRRDVLRQLAEVYSRSTVESGLLADEFMLQTPSGFPPATYANEMLDRRISTEDQGGYSYGPWQTLWGRTTAVALAKLKAYAPAEAQAHVGEVFAVRGFAALRLAEDYCPGFPLHDIVDYKLIYGPPLSTEQALERALANFDSAVTFAADSARVLNFALIGRARTLLDLGRYSEVGTALAAIPNDYAYLAEYSYPDPYKANWLSIHWWDWGTENGVANREGGIGPDYVSATDPRVQLDSLGMAADSVTVLYGMAKYPDLSSPVVLASGVEARLIEAEVALHAQDLGTWLAKLNQLRQTVGLSDTTDPGNDDARVDLTFRERAFWLFGTGHRLGDMRRLVRVYGRPTESVFPTGSYWLGGNYGTETSIPISPIEGQYSPGVTGCASL